MTYCDILPPGGDNDLSIEKRSNIGTIFVNYFSSTSEPLIIYILKDDF